MLKIAAPFCTKDEVLPLLDAGADELYCGYLPSQWIKQYSSLEFERKGKEGSNFSDFKELKTAIDCAHKRNVPVYLALNGLYVKDQYPLLLAIIKKLGHAAFDGYIVADLGLLLTLRGIGFRGKIHISTGGTVFNSEAVDFYRDLGASRIVLDRQVSLQEMRDLSGKHPAMQFEVFILNTLCVYIDGFCTHVHAYGKDPLPKGHLGKYGADNKLTISSGYAPALGVVDACMLKYSVKTRRLKDKKLVGGERIRPYFYKQLCDGVECGACALYDIKRMKIGVLKIIGRQLSPENRITSVKFIRSVLDILGDTGGSREAFLRQTQKLYGKTFEYKGACIGNNCYHPFSAGFE
jgi:putative protease